MEQKKLQKYEYPGPVPGYYEDITPSKHTQRNLQIQDADFQIIEEYRRRRDVSPDVPQTYYQQPAPGAVMFSLFAWACVFGIVIVAGYGIFQAAIGIMAGVLSMAEVVGRYLAMAGGVALLILMIGAMFSGVRAKQTKAQSDNVTINQTVYYTTEKK